MYFKMDEVSTLWKSLGKWGFISFSKDFYEFLFPLKITCAPNIALHIKMLMPRPQSLYVYNAYLFIFELIFYEVKPELL